MGAKKSSPHGYWKYAFTLPIVGTLLLGLNKPSTAWAQHGAPAATARASSATPACRALLSAVKAKDPAEVAALLKTATPDCAYEGDGEPRSPLVAAARQGNVAIGQLLVGAGAAVGFHAAGDETPLMAAAANGHLVFVKFLVGRGAETNTQVPGDGNALLVAAREGHANIVRYLIAHGADANGQVASDGTPLICSVRNGHYEVAKVLLDAGADPSLASGGDEDPVFYARESKDQAMQKLLQQYQKRP